MVLQQGNPLNIRERTLAEICGDKAVAGLCSRRWLADNTTSFNGSTDAAVGGDSPANPPDAGMYFSFPLLHFPFLILSSK